MSTTATARLWQLITLGGNKEDVHVVGPRSTKERLVTSCGLLLTEADKPLPAKSRSKKVYASTCQRCIRTHPEAALPPPPEHAQASLRSA